MRLAVTFLLGATICSLSAADASSTGPETAKRFPPLKLPAGFKATLFACDPFIEYPSVIALGPKPGTLFVGVDYMTGLGTEIVRRSEVRLIADTDGDGYADKSTVYADGFNSIQGLEYRDGVVYVMHAPFFTALRDTKDTGKADERKDLLKGLGLTPEENPVRLHCANGVVAGHDNWLYLALGDHGCDVKRLEGDRLVFNGGGILRCRPDGSDLHVFSTGLRNVYDLSLDEDLNVFLRDNENDGGDYKLRVCHSFFGADHGYPYLYYERPDEALSPLADVGLGSSAGGACYLERQFPAAYRGGVFNCEWGRSLIFCKPERSSSGFAPLKEMEFAAGAENDPYGFKPTDVVVDRDGSLLVSDWCDGQRPKRGRGRIYRITYPDAQLPAPEPKSAVGRLDSDSYSVRIAAHRELVRRGADGTADALAAQKLGTRGRLQRIWILAQVRGQEALEPLFEIAATDKEPRVRAQAVRAIADLTDPILVKHRLDAGVGDAKIAARLAALANDEPIVQLEVIIALGRLRWADAPAWISKTLTKPDSALAHAAMMTLRKCGNWPDVLKMLAEPPSPMRAIALRAIANQHEPVIVDYLIDRLGEVKNLGRRTEYADALIRVYMKPPAWTYWGYRPAPRPANSVSWEKTEAIEQALDRVLAHEEPSVRLATLKRMQREKISARTPTLITWLHKETSEEAMLAILEALRGRPAEWLWHVLEKVISAEDRPVKARLMALDLFSIGLDAENAPRLVRIANSIADGPVMAGVLHLIANKPRLKSPELLLSKLGSKDLAVRTVAIDGLADWKVDEAKAPIRKMLVHADVNVRRSASAAAGKLNDAEATDALLALCRDPQSSIRGAALDSLRLLRETRAVAVAASMLNDADTQRSAVSYLADLGGPEQVKAIFDSVRQNPAADVLSDVLRTFTTWRQSDAQLERDIAELQGALGVLGRWHAIGPVANDPTLIERAATVQNKNDGKLLFGIGVEARTRINLMKQADGSYLAHCEAIVPERTDVQFLVGSNAAYRFWVNGKPIHKIETAVPYRADAERFDSALEKGANRVLLHFPAPKGDVDFHVRFRRKSSAAAHEKLAQAALARSGNVENGRKLFFNAEKTQCIKCHRLGEQGERIGPELTGVGNRFSRIYLIESILEPSRTIASSFQSFAITMTDGRTVTGVKIAETETTVTYADNQGKKHELRKADIEAQRPEKLSVMPEGMEKSLSADEFVDLVAFLVSQKDAKPK